VLVPDVPDVPDMPPVPIVELFGGVAGGVEVPVVPTGDPVVPGSEPDTVLPGRGDVVSAVSRVVPIVGRFSCPDVVPVVELEDEVPVVPVVDCEWPTEAAAVSSAVVASKVRYRFAM